MTLSREIVRYSAKGLTRAADGTIARSTHVFAKVSRAEVVRVVKHFQLQVRERSFERRDDEEKMLRSSLRGGRRTPTVEE